MKSHILIIGGDGVGPEVTTNSHAVLRQIEKKYQHQFEYSYATMGHIAIQQYGTPLPNETLQKAKNANAILFGAIGDPLYDNDPTLKVRPEQGLLEIRKKLHLHTNLRPIIVFEELIDSSPLKSEVVKGTDILFFRELISGIYFGEKKRSTDKQSASDLMQYHKSEIERIARLALEAAQHRKKKLCSVDKANVLESSRLWRTTVQELALKYPDVEVSHMFVDNAAMQLIKEPTQFDVVLTSNLFGDILTDEASQIAGSLGMLPSASIGGSVGIYEPIHGSAPTIAGQNIANPIASILSVALLLKHALGLTEESNAVIAAVKQALHLGYRTVDIACKSTSQDNILGTKEMAKHIINYL